jgi:gliding motility-associated-like protein
MMDPYGKFPTLCPYGGNYSVKLGNNLTGGEAEGLSYTFQVPNTADTFSFTYFYAVVFEDPQHAAIEQPRFFVTAYDVLTGDLINCASYNYISNGAIPGFQRSAVQPNVWYKNWSPVSIQFAGLANRQVRLEFKTADCTQGGHFGYAYVDVGAGCSNILATAPYCIETNSLLLNAPYGFKNYTWYTSDYSSVVGNQQSIVLSPPPSTSGVFYVDIEPYPGYGCRDTVQAVVKPLPVPDTPVAKSDYEYCQFETANVLTATPQPGSDLIWYATAVGGVGSFNAPIPSTAVAGTFTYYVSQKVLFGCESFRKKITVIIHPTPITSFITNSNRQCQVNNEFVFTSTSTSLNKSSYTWTFGDGTSQSSDSIATHTYSKYGSYTVKLKVLNPPSCFQEKTITVIVDPKPIAVFSYPLMICEKQTPVQLKDSSYVPAGFSTINQWWWEIDGKTIQVKNPNPLTVNTAGKIPIKLVVTSVQGCKSDTNVAVVNVRYRPNASYTFGGLLCDNEVLRFADQSRMPPGATPEYINKWYWQFDDGTNSLLQNPSRNFVAGVHYAKLIAETNYGCKSNDTTGSFKIQAKASIGLEINDSCVLRTIKYNAIDRLNTVNKWYWDLGNGLSQGNSIVTRTYTREGYRPLTLMGETIHGCKDTILRAFTIYDNKALAGKDTIAARDEPVQLYSHGGPNVRYTWSPSMGLNDAAIENPIATLDRDQLYRLDAITDKGCDSHSQIFIKRYKGPELYIPNAFTPDGDGKNDLLKVFPIGIKTFNFFAIYNRYGQLVFRSTDYLKGWNGTYTNGKPADQGTYVAISQAVDYKGNLMMKKTTVILLR